MPFFLKKGNQIQELKTKYNTVEKNVDKISNELEKHQVTLLKDVELLDRMYELNLNYYKELSMYILAGKKKLKEVRENDLTAQSRADFLLLLTLLLSFLTSLHLTESLIHRQSTQVHLDILMKSVKRTLLTYLTDTSIREHII